MYVRVWGLRIKFRRGDANNGAAKVILSLYKYDLLFLLHWWFVISSDKGKGTARIQC